MAGGLAKRIGAPYALAMFGTACLLASLFYVFRVAMRVAQLPDSTEAQTGLGR
jgi:hypothetical protein